jgi:hypothetical protein
MKGFLSRSAADGLSLGSLVKHSFTKERNSSLQRGFIDGGTLFTILKITLF